MTQDQQTYKRAAGAALIGLVTQLVLAIGMALLGLYAESATLHAAAWHLFGGLPIWIILWVIYHQHQLERAEALEAEQLARADARTAAIFEEAGQQLQLARNRLESLYKYAVPIVSIGVGLYLLVVGGLMLWSNGSAWEKGTLAKAALRGDAGVGLVTVLLVAVALVAFLVSRYVAGMTQVKSWQLLRGGAAYLMGNTAVAVLLIAAAVLTLVGNAQGFVLLALGIPAVMVLLGVEMLVGYVLSIYRPRRPGEMVRPAFDSRVLGLLTRPESLGKIVSETLNYQFGFEISRSWFYRLLARAVTPLILVGIAVLVGLSSLVIVAPQENAVITTFGSLERVVGPGLHFKWPWPIGQDQKYDVYRVQQILVGSLAEAPKESTAILWTNEHAPGTEEYLVIAPTQATRLAGGAAAAPSEDDGVGAELVGAEVVVKYHIADGEGLKAYVQSAVNPAQMLQDLAARRVTSYFVTRDIDTLLTEDRLHAGELLREQIQADVDAVGPHGLGLRIVFVGVMGVHPPQTNEVAAKFHEQIGAMQKQQTAIEAARRESIRILAEVAGSPDRARKVSEAIEQHRRLQRELERVQAAATPDTAAATRLASQIRDLAVQIEADLDAAGGRAAQLIFEARAYRWAQATTEFSRAERFAAQLEAYRLAPEYYRMRTYFQTLGEGMAESRKIIVASEQQQPATLRLNLEDAGGGLDSVFNPN